MALQLRFLLVIASFSLFIYLIHKIKKSQMKIEDSIYWIFLSLCFLILSIFPNIAIVIGKWMGIESTVNLVFLVIIFMLLVKCFLQSVKISQMEYKINSLVQEIAIKTYEDYAKEAQNKHEIYRSYINE
jgi:hypothetical protein